MLRTQIPDPDGEGSSWILGEEAVRGAGFGSKGGECWILGLYTSPAQPLFPKPSLVPFFQAV